MVSLPEIDMEYSVKAVQYIRKKSDPGKWMPVDTLPIIIIVSDPMVQSDPTLLHKHIKSATQQMLGKNWLPAHYEQHNAIP